MMMSKTGRAKPKLLIGAFVVGLALVYLVVTTAQSATAYYLTVAEVMEQGPSARRVRVAGEVLGDTIAWNDNMCRARSQALPKASNNSELVLCFDVVDADGADTRILSVIHHGPRPDMLRDGASVILEGSYTDQGMFEASRLLLQCPSKYEAP
jgi:cytochrome c-type biogenesis protein CcmE